MDKRLPDFEKMTLDEIAEFWATHDSADYWDQMEDVPTDGKIRESQGDVSGGKRTR